MMRYKYPDETHSGFKNRETWIAALALSNDRSTAEIYRQLARSAESDSAAADALERAFCNAFLSPLRGFAVDLMNSALMRIDWATLAKGLRED